jgi:methionyl-tRNA formyltransferase
MNNLVDSGVVLFIYSELGFNLLKIILKKKIKIHLVITHINKKKERIWYPSCSELCKKRKINYIYFEKTSFDRIYNIIKDQNVSCILSAYFRKLLPEKILNVPKYGAVNLHGSFLPYYRGRAPANWQIINGEKYSGGTIHYMNKFVDKGNIIYQKKISITSSMTAFQLQKKINKTIISIINKHIYKIIKGICPSIKQRKIGSYFRKRKPSDGRIIWNKSANDVYNLIRGLSSPYPGAFFLKDNKKIYIEKCSISNIKSINYKPKYLYINKNLFIKCKDFYIKIIKMKRNNKITNFI